MLAFHKKIKVQFIVKADIYFDEVNNDNLYNCNYANKSEPSQV